ncbi:tRNA (adenosine(37)-N6)-threonylcarbamoyltransferase complex transferase subunit TsaD [Desulfolutivibrio sulfoxidireducens]|uniref:tRNA (adenosine(37)-N6)-threonylcarbamoyltransferase complex transferase subunit TsaD n=1 Tax=Desulfolutivibrio sulfoxidireducens TaxID=2773299 RepID=UPI00159E0BDA|nr:tRNA (adenosine(37)-N6)-threonylcarbamoyltransferase complex transferase subunit TsaD [Desulfolutivibrio sulfoxidireducens]QLA16175.1 tRNA (adenosine(37)-N6)-threonylcarbamoyltransferase complex transferase subunit TsaD [Desulfolutivibrio sulfoxidireducens]
MLVLGIETSCDETSLALVSDDGPLLEKTALQEEVHSLFGGVVPELASREHLRLIGPLCEALFSQAGRAPRDLDAVAVARGPGLLGSLLVGLGLAKGLCLATGAPLVGVNHLHAHLLAAGIGRTIPYPALGLLVSGGHTQIWRMTSDFDFTLLGRTLDDAAGEAFDKTAKMLNLPYPGGRYIDALGRGVEPDHRLFPRPHLADPGLDFSFSGLKTAVAEHVRGNPGLRLARMPGPGEDFDPALASPGTRLACASLNWAVADTLRIKLFRAIQAFGPFSSLIVAGGVAANSRIRDMAAAVAERMGLALVLPPLALCSDNGTMIAHMGLKLARAGLGHDLGLDAIPRGKKIPWDYRVLPLRESRVKDPPG